MSKDCHLKVLYLSLQIFSKGGSPTVFLVEKKKSKKVENLEEGSRARTEFSAA